MRNRSSCRAASPGTVVLRLDRLSCMRDVLFSLLCLLTAFVVSSLPSGRPRPDLGRSCGPRQRVELSVVLVSARTLLSGFLLCVARPIQGAGVPRLGQRLRLVFFFLCVSAVDRLLPAALVDLRGAQRPRGGSGFCLRSCAFAVCTSVCMSVNRSRSAATRARRCCELVAHCGLVGLVGLRLTRPDKAGSEGACCWCCCFLCFWFVWVAACVISVVVCLS